MKAAFIFNPFSYKVHEENLRVVQRYFGLFPPLSMSWVAAIARRAGHDVILVDARTMRLSLSQTASILKKFQPDILGAMMTTYMFPDTLEWVRYLRRDLEAAGLKPKVLIGGYNLRVYPKESVSYPEIDFGCVEHAIHTVPALFAALERGETDLSCVPGLVWKKDGESIVNPHPQPVIFDEFPNPARDLLPNDLYAEFLTRRKNFTVMVTSLGCPFRCAFCEAGGDPYNARRPETVVAEMRECYERYGVREIDIFDYQLTADRERVLEICRLMRENRLDIDWACRSRVDTVDEQLLKAMRQAGCRRIYWGIEHYSPQVLKTLKKSIVIERITETIRLSRREGIENLGFFLIGVHGETPETVKRTVEFAKSLQLDYVQFSKLLAKPQTQLWKQMTARTGKDYWKDWVLGKENDRELERPWLTSMRNEDVDRLAKWAYVKYHSRPMFLLRHLLRCRSLWELLRKTFAYMEMVFFQEQAARPARGFLAYPENIFRLLRRRAGFLKSHEPANRVEP